jgi:hypothetical protein
MKNLLLVLIVCILVNTSCNREQASHKYDLDSFRPLNHHELFKKIDVVLLDSIPDHPISFIIKMVCHDNLFYIQDWFRTSLLVYNLSGEFVRSIGSKGRGPGELQDIRDFQINRFTGNLEILGNPTPFIMIYDTQGNFIEKRNIGNRMITIDKFYHINPDLTAWLSMAEDYKISVFSEKLNKVVHEFSLGMDKAFLGFLSYHKPFSHYGDTTYFYDTYSNTIFRFNVEKLEFDVHKNLDFGNHNFNKSLLPHPKEWEAMDHVQQRDFLKKIIKNLIQEDKYIENDDYSVLTRSYHNIFSRKQDNSVIEFYLFADSISFFIQDMNNSFAFNSLRLSRIDGSLNESMVGKDVYQKLKKISLEDKNEETHGIIKYWFK